jgi:hypothetical protein
MLHIILIIMAFFFNQHFEYLFFLSNLICWTIQMLMFKSVVLLITLFDEYLVYHLWICIWTVHNFLISICEQSKEIPIKIIWTNYINTILNKANCAFYFSYYYTLVHRIQMKFKSFANEKSTMTARQRLWKSSTRSIHPKPS